MLRYLTKINTGQKWKILYLGASTAECGIGLKKICYIVVQSPAEIQRGFFQVDIIYLQLNWTGVNIIRVHYKDALEQYSTVL